MSVLSSPRWAALYLFISFEIQLETFILNVDQLDNMNVLNPLFGLHKAVQVLLH